MELVTSDFLNGTILFKGPGDAQIIPRFSITVRILSIIVVEGHLMQADYV